MNKLELGTLGKLFGGILNIFCWLICWWSWLLFLKFINGLASFFVVILAGGRFVNQWAEETGLFKNKVDVFAFTVVEFVRLEFDETLFVI